LTSEKNPFHLNRFFRKLASLSLINEPDSSNSVISKGKLLDLLSYPENKIVEWLS
jgi:hypothetical protein